MSQSTFQTWSRAIGPLVTGSLALLALVAMTHSAAGQTAGNVSVMSPDDAFPAHTNGPLVVAQLPAPAMDAASGGGRSSERTDDAESSVPENPWSGLLSSEQLTPTLRTVMLVGILSLAPAVFVMSTCFVRFAIVFGLLRQGLGAQQWLPNQIVLALSLFLTLFVMAPVWTRSYDIGVKPYVEGNYVTPADERAAFDAALTSALVPVRQFMSTQIAATGNEAAIDMLLSYQREGGGDSPVPQYYEDVPLNVLFPAYLLSELKTAFVIGFQIVLPFLVIDLVVASVLTGMGLMMLPPVLVSLPFKLLLFVLIDGWTLTVETLLRSVPMG